MENKPRKAIFAGSFDPITNGHLDIICRASKLFDELQIGVLNNPNKKGLFSFDERVKLIEKSTSHLNNIKVVTFDGLLINYCQENGIGALVRGVRSGADVDYELQMAHMNRELNPDIETIILPSCTKYSFISSSLIKEVLLFDADIKNLVPKIVLEELKKKTSGGNWYMKIDLEMIELFEQLEDIFRSASTIPFSHKCTVDKDEVLAIINDIRTLIPEEVTQAVWINKERNKIISQAKQDATNIVEQAKKEAERIQQEYQDNIEELKKNSEDVVKAYVESSEPVVQADQRAKDIVDRAERIANEIRIGSIEYAEDVLSSVEYNLREILEEVKRDKAELRPKK